MATIERTTQTARTTRTTINIVLLELEGVAEPEEVGESEEVGVTPSVATVYTEPNMVVTTPPSSKGVRVKPFPPLLVMIVKASPSTAIFWIRYKVGQQEWKMTDL